MIAVEEARAAAARLHAAYGIERLDSAEAPSEMAEAPPAASPGSH